MLRIIFSSILGILFFQASSQKLSIDFITTNLVECNSFYNEEHRAYTLITDSGLVQIDTYYFGWLTQKTKNLISDTLKRSDFKYLITTHAHSCHVKGNYCFNEAKHIGHQNTIPIYNNIRNNANNEFNKLKSLTALSLEQQDLLKETEIIKNLPNPALTFNDSLTLNIDNQKIHLYYYGNSGHSDSEVLIYIPNEQTLIIGQILGRSYFLPVIKENVSINDLKHKTALLEKLSAMDIKHILSNHQGRIAKKDLIFAKTYYENLLKDSKFLIDKNIDLQAYKFAFGLERKYPDLSKRHAITDDLNKQNEQNVSAVYNMFNQQ